MRRWGILVVVGIAVSVGSLGEATVARAFHRERARALVVAVFKGRSDVPFLRVITPPLA